VLIAWKFLVGGLIGRLTIPPGCRSDRHTIDLPSTGQILELKPTDVGSIRLVGGNEELCLGLADKTRV